MVILNAPVSSKGSLLDAVIADRVGRCRPVLMALALLATTTLAATPAAPTTADMTVQGSEDTELQSQIAASDSDGAKLAYSLKRKPRHGTATLDSTTGAFNYLPQKDFAGADALWIDVSNGKRKATAVVTLEVAAVNDGPVTAALLLKTAEDVAASGKVVASDAEHDSLSFAVSTGALHGEASVDARTGAVSYKPVPDYHGPDTFTVEVSDGQSKALAEVSVIVASVNDGPVAAAANFTVDEDARLEGALVASDVDGDALTFQLAKPTKHGQVEVKAQTGAFTYVPAKDFNGDDAFTVDVTDGKRKATSTISLRVAPVNDAPVTDGLSLVSREDVAVSGAVPATDVDVNNLSYKLSAPAAHGTVRVDEKTGRLTYTPADDYNGADAFTIEVSDGALVVSSQARVTISAVNDAPRVAAAPFSLDEDTRFEGQLVASDVDGDTVVYRAAREPAHGVFELNAQTGAFSHHPARDFFGADGFVLEVSDGKLKSEAAIALEVRAVNDSPIAKPLVLSTKEDVAAKGTVIASDVDDGALAYSVSTAALHGLASVDARTGAVTYAPAADYNGADAFTIEVKDGSLSAMSQVSVSVAAIPDLPRVKPQVLLTAEDEVGEGTLPGWDADGDRLVFQFLAQPRLGTAVLTDAATGAWRFAPHADLNGVDELLFEVTDGTTSVRGAVKIEVAPVNDAPTLAKLELSTREDEGVDGQLIAADIDGDALTYFITTAPARGQPRIVDAAKGAVRFEPARDQNGAASFTVTVSDGKAKSAPAMVAVRIEAQNDAPVATGQTLTTKEDTQLAGSLNAADVDGETLSFAIARAPQHGTVIVTDAEFGLFVYSPAPNYFGSDDFDFVATDRAKASSVATIRIKVTPVDDAPIATASGLTAPFRGTVTGRLNGYDRESRSVTYRIVAQPSNGRVTLLNERTGDFEFSTDGTTSSTVEFHFEVSDGALTSSPGPVMVEIRSL